MRLFVAAAVTDEVRERLSEAQSALRTELSGADIRWSNLEQSHLTLRFLGEVAERDLPACRLAVSEAARRSKPFELATDDFGAFPSEHRPSVLWLGVGGDLEELVRLQSNVSSGLDHLTTTGAADAFRPHLTLARVKRLDRDSREAIKGLLAGSPQPVTHWRVASIELLASELRPTGSRYSEIVSSPLGG